MNKIEQLLYEGMQNKYNNWLAAERDRLHFTFYERTIAYYIELHTRTWLDGVFGAGSYTARFSHSTKQQHPTTVCYVDIDGFQTIIINLSLVVNDFHQSMDYIIRKRAPNANWELIPWHLRPSSGKVAPCYVAGSNMNAMSFADAMAESRRMYELGYRITVNADRQSCYSGNNDWQRYNINEVKDADE